MEERVKSLGGATSGAAAAEEKANREKFEELLAKERDLNNFMDGFPSRKAAKMQVRRRRRVCGRGVWERVLRGLLGSLCMSGCVRCAATRGYGSLQSISALPCQQHIVADHTPSCWPLPLSLVSAGEAAEGGRHRGRAGEDGEDAGHHWLQPAQPEEVQGNAGRARVQEDAAGEHADHAGAAQGGASGRAGARRRGAGERCGPSGPWVTGHGNCAVLVDTGTAWPEFSCIYVQMQTSLHNAARNVFLPRRS